MRIAILSPTLGDKRRAENLACLLKNGGPNNLGKTIILLSHFDTVGVDGVPGSTWRLGSCLPA
ncbi:MAG: hypothetical protein U0V48_06230 [Anaerolineales bacterium]